MCSPARETRRPRPPLRWLALPVPLTLTLALLVPSAASARPLSGEERDGQRVVNAIRDGERDCAEISRGDFVAAGEYSMGQSFDSARAHEAMDELMSEMMGERAEEQMHEYLGRRATRCGGGRAPASFAGMMATMSGMGGSMMGGFGVRSRDSGPGMMGGPGLGRVGDDDDWDAAEVVMVVLMGLLLVLAGAALLRFRPRQQPDEGGPLGILARRYATGEIDSDEYERRRRALGGTA
jgi:uncharacterized membrane protein